MIICMLAPRDTNSEVCVCGEMEVFATCSMMPLLTEHLILLLNFTSRDIKDLTHVPIGSVEFLACGQVFRHEDLPDSLSAMMMYKSK